MIFYQWFFLERDFVDGFGLVPNKSGIVKKRVSGNVIIEIENNDNQYFTINVMDNSYKSGFFKTQIIAPKGKAEFILNTEDSHNWYDFTIQVNGNELFSKQYAGHVETGKSSFTDPLMGGVLWFFLNHLRNKRK